MLTIHAYKAKSLNGGEIDFAAFRGKKIMIVNVASECGYTPQYQQLQELYENFQDKLVIIGFPCNDFGGQEPGSENEIQAFCTRNYGVSFPLAAKISIRGADCHPVYQWLTRQSLNAVADTEVTWNFQKYLMDESGHLVACHSSAVSPLDEAILRWVDPSSY